MEIPNYDCDCDNDKKFKQIYSYMPKDTFMLICGYNMDVVKLTCFIAC